MTKCAVKWCKSYSGRASQVSFHPFPRDPTRKQMWVTAVRREDSWIPTKHSHICSLHFEPNYYSINKKQRKLLKNAVPTLYLPVYSHEVQTTEIEEISTPNDQRLNCPVINRTESRKAIDNHIASPQSSTPRQRMLIKTIQEQKKKIHRLQYHNRRLKEKVAALEKERFIANNAIKN